MTRQDEIAAKAVRISTLKSLKQKRALRIRQIKEEAANKIRELNIQYSEDPERLRAKYAADDYAKSEKAKKRAAKAIEKEKKHLERERNLRPFTLGEEIFSSIVQGIGACLFIAATVLLNVFTIGKVPAEDKTLYITLFSCFGGTMTLMYIMSVLDHALTPSSAKETFKRLAHIFIFLVIGTTFTVYTFKAVTDLFGFIVFCSVWVLCFIGIIMYAIAGSRLELVNIIFYAIAGCASLLICTQLYKALPQKSFAMLIVAGVLYIVGLVFYKIRKVKFMRSISNIILLGASVYLFFSMFFFKF